MSEFKKCLYRPPKGSWRDFGTEDELRQLRGYSAQTAKKVKAPEKAKSAKARQIAKELLKKARR